MGRGSGSYSYGGGTGATDTPGGKIIITGGGGKPKPLPQENPSNDLQKKYNLIGFDKVYGGNKVQNAVLGSYADQLARLERRFGAISGSVHPTVVVTNERGTGELAAVGFNPLNPADQTLYINAAYLGRISQVVKGQKQSTKRRWSAANSGDLKANAYYTVTHEYGHMLHNQLYAKAKQAGYTGSRQEFVAQCNAEIEKIARTRYGLKGSSTVSRYGNTNGREKFAETFASSQLGGNTPMALAMRAWLDERFK